MPKKKNGAIEAVFDKETKRKNRFNIEEQNGISGSLYIDKNGETPEEIIIKIKK